MNITVTFDESAIAEQIARLVFDNISDLVSDDLQTHFHNSGDVSVKMTFDELAVEKQFLDAAEQIAPSGYIAAQIVQRTRHSITVSLEKETDANDEKSK